MSDGNDRNVFDDLNTALFAQIGKLQSIDPANEEQMKQCIEQSREVSHLAGNVISNARVAIDLMRLHHDAGIELEIKTGKTPKMLEGRY